MTQPAGDAGSVLDTVSAGGGAPEVFTALLDDFAYPPDPATQYALSVALGEIIAGPSVRKACARHLRDLREGGERGLVWRPECADRVYRFFGCLRLAEGEHEGQFFRLAPAQHFILGSLFGWHGADGYRRYQTAYVEMGKGNGKTPLAAGLCLYGLLADGESAAEIYTAAVSREQAKICFRDVKNFVSMSPALQARLTVGESNVADEYTMSYIRPVSSEGRALDGKRVFMAVIDEVHEHPTAEVVNKMRAGTKARRQPLVFEITNSGYDRTSICWQHHEHTQNVLDGVIEDDAWFGFIADLDDADDPLNDETCWAKSNPLLDVSIPRKYLAKQVAEAKSIGSMYNTVLRLNFCRWTEQVTKFFDLSLWDACNLPVDEDELVGRECFSGLDLASTSDITALVHVFPPIDEGERWKVLRRFWVPEDQVKKRVESARVPYDQWARRGFLRLTDGNVCDYREIQQQAIADAQRFVVREIAFDGWNATQITTELAGDGFTMVKFGQGYASMSAPTKALERLVNGQLIAFGADPVLRWMANNTSVKRDPAGNVKPDKEASSEKIDGIVALVMGLARANAALNLRAPTEVLMV